MADIDLPVDSGDFCMMGRDVVDLIKLFYEMLGGQKHYAKLRPEIKAIICGQKQSLIFSKFRTAGKLREYLENMEWGLP